MGDDSGPRKVLNLVRGVGPMFKIKSAQGEWTCNDRHQLVLECALSVKNGDGKTISSTYTKGRKEEVEVRDYLGWSPQKKRYFKQYRVGVEFPEVPTPHDPYIVGIWIGDGSAHAAALTQVPGAALDRWKEYFSGLGFALQENAKKGNAASTWHARKTSGLYNSATDYFRTLIVNGEKRIPREYLVNCREKRLQLLAGLLDSDGWVEGKGGMGYCTKYAGLKDDVEFLARSLGFRVTSTLTTKHIRSLNFTGQYWRSHISGDMRCVPGLVKKLTASSRAAHREPFEVIPLGDGEYCGFTVDGNNRFLLADFVVTHNSFSVGVWLYLDWLRDPENTNILVVGPSENHLQQNLFSHLVNLHNNSAIPSPGSVTSLCISLNPHDQYAGIKGVVIPLGKKSAGRLQGVKVKPRQTPHHKLGKMTRLRIFLEEAENIHVGVWEDLVNVTANAANNQQFKVVAAYNPKDRASPVGVRAEPLNGWGSVDVETNDSWYTKRGWRLLRLDGHKSENVLQGAEIFPGLQTSVGLEKLILQAGGANTASAYTMARGWYPEEGLDTVVIPPALTKDEHIRGEYIFAEEPVTVASLDVALEGGDNAILCLGRYGRAMGVRKHPDLQHPKGEEQIFKDALGQRFYRSVLQVDQFVLLPKGRTEELVEEVLKVTRAMGIRPEWLGVDRTGNGAGVHDLLRSKLGDSVKGINSSTSSTDHRILAEDTKLPCDEYNLLATELWFAVKKWVEVGVLKFASTLPSDPIVSELSGRRFIQPTGQPKVRVESKKEYKSRGNKSPDRADALTLLLHTVRLQTGITQSFSAKTGAGEDWRPARQRIGATDRPHRLD